MSQGGTLTIAAVDPTIPTSFPTDAGTAVPAANALTIVGGEGIDVSGAAATVTVSGELASTTNIGMAAFDSDTFSVVDGLVSLTTGALGLVWETITTDTKEMVAGHGYINKNATPANQTVYTLPIAAEVGHMIVIVGYTAGGWKIAQNGWQQIFLPEGATTAGIAGSVASLGGKDMLILLCITQDDEFSAVAPTDDFGVV